MSSFITKYSPFLARLCMAIVFIYAAIGEIIGFSGSVAFFGQVTHWPFPAVFIIIGIALELGGSVLLLLGYKTTWAASALIVFTLLTIALFHSNFGDPAQVVNALKNLAIIGGLLMVTVYGSGAVAFDNIKKREKKVPVKPVPVEPAPSPMTPPPASMA